MSSPVISKRGEQDSVSEKDYTQVVCALKSLRLPRYTSHPGHCVYWFIQPFIHLACIYRAPAEEQTQV